MMPAYFSWTTLAYILKLAEICHRLGLLALVLGNGELQVVAVPHPQAALQALGPSQVICCMHQLSVACDTFRITTLGA